MKKLGLLLSVMILFSCNDTKEKELQLKEKELELKEKQLQLDSIKAVANTTLEETKVKDSVVKEETLKVKESDGVGVKKLKFPKGQLNSKYTYEFKCDDELWGKCQLILKKNNKIFQRKIFNNSVSKIYDIQLIDNKFLFFSSEVYGGADGLTALYHYLIELDKFNIYRYDVNCLANDLKSCKIDDPLQIFHFKYYVSEPEDIF